jgi:hypothetical protein
MKRIALVFLLSAAGTGGAAPRPEAERDRPAPKGEAGATAASTEAPTTPAAPQTKWALPDLPPVVETERPLGTARQTDRPGASKASSGGLAKPGTASSPRAKRTPGLTPSATSEAGSRSLLRSMTARSVVEGEARVVLADVERVVRPGDLLGGDTVRSVAEGLIVLDRPAAAGQAGGPATVVVRFEADGRARVRVYHEQDPTPVKAPRTE